MKSSLTRYESNDTPISIVTTVRNGAGGIARTIESIARQKSLDFQYLVIDGGSTDGTLEVLKENDGIISLWVSELDRGISNAFNKGITLATGDLVGFLNAGDWYEPDTLQSVAHVLNLHPQIDVICGSIQFWERRSRTLLCHSDPERIDKETSVYHPTVFIKKSAYLKYGLYDESYKLAMDYELLLRFKRAGAKFFNIEKTLANMPLDGVSHKHWYEGLKEVRRARSSYFSSANVAYHHLRAVAMNLAARGLKSFGLRKVYQAYWRFHNNQIASSGEQGS